jgi:hypothetical protein
VGLLLGQQRVDVVEVDPHEAGRHYCRVYVTSKVAMQLVMPAEGQSLTVSMACPVYPVDVGLTVDCESKLQPVLDVEPKRTLVLHISPDASVMSSSVQLICDGCRLAGQSPGFDALRVSDATYVPGGGHPPPPPHPTTSTHDTRNQTDAVLDMGPS